MQTIVETDRLRLRAFKETDLDDLFRLVSDPEVMRFSIDGPHTREMTSTRLTAMILMQETCGYSPFPCFKKPDDEFIGYCGLQALAIEGRQEIEITYRMATAHWGIGYATEAARACRDHAFETLKKQRVVSVIDPNNVGSVKVAERIGMTNERTISFKNIEADLYSVKSSAIHRDPRRNSEKR
ncbi:MAG: GNAT family N-acetyltransferase [Synoicihabitans sp.]